jgi:hypothetical protein
VTELAQRRERRREPRTQIARPVYVESDDARGNRFEEVRTTRDLNRYGFYFVTETSSYRPGMQVHTISTFGSLNLEFVAEVVRVEPLPNGEFGVAVHLLRVRDPLVGLHTTARSIFHSFAQADTPLPAAPGPAQTS